MKLRKILGLMLVAMLILSACGQSPAEQSDSSKEKANNVEKTDNPEPKAENKEASTESSEPVEISFWHSMDGVFAEILDKQVNTFNETIGKGKKIKVIPVFQNWPGTESLMAAMSTDDVANMPDVIQLYSESVNIIQDYARTLWPEEYIEKGAASFKKEDLIPNAVTNYSINGKMIGLPYTVSSLLLYYNQDYFEQVGVNQPPKTIAEMAEIMSKLKGNVDAEYGLNVRVQLYELENWIATQGTEGSWFGNNDSGRSGAMTELVCDKDGNLENYLNEWQKVVDTEFYKANRDSINDEFAAGMHGMVIMSSSRIPTIKNLVGESFAWQVAPLPRVSASDAGGCTPSGSGLFMLDRGDDGKKAAAWEFLQFMVSPEAQAMWLEGTGYVPVNKQTQELEAYKKAIEEEPRLQVPYEAIMKSPAKAVQSFCPNSSTVDSTIKEAMIAFGTGEADKATTLQKISEGAANALEEYYRVNPTK